MSSLYVAGPWVKRKQIHEMIQHLRANKWTITHDWTEAETIVVDANYADVQYMQKCAENDITGVRNADVILALMEDPYYPYIGTWTEVGAALALGKPVVICCPWEVSPNIDKMQTPAKNVFFYHSGVIRVHSWQQCLDMIPETWKETVSAGATSETAIKPKPAKPFDVNEFDQLITRIVNFS